MEETKDHASSQRKALNFNAPLLTTRRPANLASISIASCHGARRRNSAGNGDGYAIPFSWEKAPGEPKVKEVTERDHRGDGDCETPRPKLPPSLWRFRHMIAAATTEKDDHDDIGCHADFDSDCDGERDDDDVFSLSEAIDIVERSQKSREMSPSDGLRLKIIEDRSRSDDQYPDFIIQRFLPDATALATASALQAMSLKKSIPSPYEAPNSSATASFPSPKGCGFEMIFPWRGKHRLCGVKSPVRRVAAGAFGGMNQLNRRHKEKQQR